MSAPISISWLFTILLIQQKSNINKRILLFVIYDIKGHIKTLNSEIRMKIDSELVPDRVSCSKYLLTCL